MNLFKDIMVFSLVVGILGAGIYLLVNTVNYFDAGSLCYIDLDGHILNGNKKTIIDALKSIKQKDKEQYRTVCGYVKKISENYCIGSDWHLDPMWREKSIGKDCYIKGSKTIYLYPQEENSFEIVAKRADSISKLSNLSKNFWANK